MSIRVRSITDLMSKEAIGKALTEYYNIETEAQKKRRIRSLVTQNLSESDSDIEEIAENYNIDANENPKVIYGRKEDKTLFGFSPDTDIDNMGTENFFLEKQFKCTICEKTLNYKSSFKYHSKIHTGEKPYECHICRNSFRQKYDRDRHIISHTGEEPFQCEVCGKAFRYQSNCTRHKKLHNREKKSICKICEKSFTTERNLVKHMTIHSLERPYDCNKYKKSFKYKSSLGKHGKIIIKKA